jgi:hypothetical protein
MAEMLIFVRHFPLAQFFFFTRIYIVEVVHPFCVGICILLLGQSIKTSLAQVVDA